MSESSVCVESGSGVRIMQKALTRFDKACAECCQDARWYRAVQPGLLVALSKTDATRVRGAAFARAVLYRGSYSCGL